MKTFIFTVFCSLLLSACFAQPIPTDSLYLGQTPPGSTPKVFNLPVSAGSFAAERIAISNDGKEICYSVIHNYYPTAGDTIKYYKYDGNKWTGPFNLFNGYLAPGLSLTGDTMYFQNNVVPYQTLFSYRNGAGWSNPQRILYSLNSSHYLQVTNNGHYYISSVSNPGIGASDWCRLYMNGTDTTAVSLGLPLNNTADNLDFFVSRDESYMIIAKNGLKISYHKGNGGWTNPKSLGAAINFGIGMWGPFISSDDKYLFYTTGTNPNYSDCGIRWVRIDGLLDSLRHTNYIPYLKNQIPDQTDSTGHLFNFTVPDSTFIDDDGNNTITYSATLSNGGALPSWLSFNPVTRTFSGTPVTAETIGLKVIVTDSANAIASCIFILNVVQHTAINPINENIINDYKLFQNFPNPFNPSTVIGYTLPKNSFVSIKVYDVLGRQIASMVNSFQKRGYQEITLNTGNLNLSSGIYLYSLTANEANSNKVYKETKAMNYIK
jgi:hypothetical protein